MSILADLFRRVFAAPEARPYQPLASLKTGDWPILDAGQAAPPQVFPPLTAAQEERVREIAQAELAAALREDALAGVTLHPSNVALAKIVRERLTNV